ncbi:unnamed protein product [Prorocentrum cordatum]|uniref:Uncharacterized protein n=1 Tax=Prorocentrum cordatum TaxID=2364126 RepID=A0ABN9V8B6_9DINO|nr:unnamed protein product [Polarella glacialis]
MPGRSVPAQVRSGQREGLELGPGLTPEVEPWLRPARVPSGTASVRSGGCNSRHILQATRYLKIFGHCRQASRDPSWSLVTILVVVSLVLVLFIFLLAAKWGLLSGVSGSPRSLFVLEFSQAACTGPGSTCEGARSTNFRQCYFRHVATELQAERFAALGRIFYAALLRKISPRVGAMASLRFWQARARLLRAGSRLRCDGLAA